MGTLDFGVFMLGAKQGRLLQNVLPLSAVSGLAQSLELLVDAKSWKALSSAAVQRSEDELLPLLLP